MFRQLMKMTKTGRNISKGGLLLTSTLLASSYRNSNVGTENNQNTDQKLPLHYKKMKELRAQWQNNPETAIQDRHDETKDPRKEILFDEGDAKKIFARAKQIKELYQDTHYVFLHGQSPGSGTIMIYLAQILAEKNGVSKSKFFKQFRTPNFFENAPEASALQELVKAVQNGETVDCDDPVAQKLMLSVDACDKHSTSENSAYYFVKYKTSINGAGDLIDQVVPGEDYHSSENRRTFVDNIINLHFSLWNSAHCGNLLVFCIPKELLTKAQNPDLIAYRSHTLGRKCDCHTGHDIEILENLMNNNLGKGTECKADNEGIPQYRLIASSLTPQNGVLCFMLTPFTKEKRKEIKTEVNHYLTSYLNSKEKEQDVVNDTNTKTFRSSL